MAGSVDSDYPRLEEIDLSAPILLMFDELKLTDLALGLAIGPCRGDRRLDRFLVLYDPIRKRGEEAARGVIHPNLKFVRLPATNDVLELCNQVARLRQRRDAALNRRHCDRLRFGKLIASDREQAGDRSSRWRAADSASLGLSRSFPPCAPLAHDIAATSKAAFSQGAP